MKSLLLTAAVFLHNTQAQPTTCSCSPTRYTFRLDLSSNCDSSTISEEDVGTNGSLCFFGEGSSSGTGVFPGEMVLGGKGGTGPIRKMRESRQTNDARRLQVDLAAAMRAPTSPITEVTSILFLEVDTSPELNIINQDSTYFTTNLDDGALVTYASISNQLDYTVPLEDQMEYVPGGVVVVLFGNDEEGNVVQNTVAWDYDVRYCDGQPLKVDDGIGWVIIDDYAPAKAAFCPAVDAPPPTPQPTITVVETKAPSSSPMETTVSPIGAEVTETQPPTIVEVVESTTSTVATTTESTEDTTQIAVETTSEPSYPSKSGKYSSMSYASKGTKLFKESKTSKVFNSVVSGASKSGKDMSIQEAKAGKISSDAKAGKEMSMKEAKSEKPFASKSSQMSVSN